MSALASPVRVLVCCLLLSATALGQRLATENGDIVFTVENGRRVGFRIGDGPLISLSDLPSHVDLEQDSLVRGIALGYQLGSGNGNLATYLMNNTDRRLETISRELAEKPGAADISSTISGIVRDVNSSIEELSVQSSRRLDQTAEQVAANTAAINNITNCNRRGLIFDTESGTCGSLALGNPQCNNATLGSVKINVTTMQLMYCSRGPNNTFSFVGVGSQCDLVGDPMVPKGGVPLRSCKEYRDQHECAMSGVYNVRYANGNILPTYCDMDTAGGGWNLILTLFHGNNQYGGTTSPFIRDLNGNNPSVSAPYSRNWQNRINPNTESEFLLKRSNGDWVRFEENYAWCGWNNRGGCHGVSSHIQFTRGRLYDSEGRGPLREQNGQGRLMERFNGCAYDGNCGSGGGDGVGFGSGPQWSHGPGGYGDVYGAGFNSRSRGGASLYWGGQSEDSPNNRPYTYFWRSGK